MQTAAKTCEHSPGKADFTVTDDSLQDGWFPVGHDQPPAGGSLLSALSWFLPAKMPFFFLTNVVGDVVGL